MTLSRKRELDDRLQSAEYVQRELLKELLRQATGQQVVLEKQRTDCAFQAAVARSAL